jgi:hypothetical protein
MSGALLSWDEVFGLAYFTSDNRFGPRLRARRSRRKHAAPCHISRPMAPSEAADCDATKIQPSVNGSRKFFALDVFRSYHASELIRRTT